MSILFKCIQKNVLINTKAGVILEGFVAELDDDFLSLVEHDNNEVILSTDDIGMLRIFHGKQGINQKTNNKNIDNDPEAPTIREVVDKINQDNVAKWMEKKKLAVQQAPPADVNDESLDPGSPYANPFARAPVSASLTNDPNEFSMVHTPMNLGSKKRIP